MANQQTYEYDVALSFAGENRPYVKEVADCLIARGVRVFYDEYEETTLWGKDLSEHLDSIYREKAKYCVMFISKEYASKAWTTHERRSAFVRALQDRGGYILPARFDDTSIDGLHSTIGFIDLTAKTPEQLALLLVKKVALASQDGDRGQNGIEGASARLGQKAIEFATTDVELGIDVEEFVRTFTGHKMEVMKREIPSGLSAAVADALKSYEDQFSDGIQVEDVTMWDIDGWITGRFDRNGRLAEYTWFPHVLRSLTKDEVNAIHAYHTTMYGEALLERDDSENRWEWSTNDRIYELCARWDSLNKGFDVNYRIRFHAFR